MASYALLIGTKAGKRSLIQDGQPVEIRRKFKDITAADGFDSVAVVDKHLGQIRQRKFVKPVAKKAVKKTAKKDS
jgi:hypothetical protein